MKGKHHLLFTSTLVSLPAIHAASTLLRGGDVDNHFSSRRLPGTKKQANKTNKLKERKRKDKKKKDKDQDKKQQWKELSKLEKKELARQDNKNSNKNNGKDNTQEGIRTQVKGNQLAYIQQYFHNLDNDMTMQSSVTEDATTWKDLSKQEKKRIQDLMDGELKLKNEQVIDVVEEEVEDNDKLTKQEKKEQMKLEKEQGQQSGNGIVQNSQQFVSQDGKDKGDNEDSSSEGKENTQNSNNNSNQDTNGVISINEALEVVIDTEDKEEDIVQNSEQTNDAKGNSDEKEEMVQNSGQFTSNNDFVLPMPQLTFGSGGTEKEEEEPSQSDQAASNSFVSGDMTQNSQQATNNDSSKCTNCFTFADQLVDPSIQLDSFDPSSDLRWSMSGEGWSTETSSCYEGNSCLASGITKDINGDNHKGETVYSNLELTLDDEFEGGVLSFQIFVEDGLAMPHEAFYVNVDDEVKLSPITFTSGKWVEYSVSVGRGKHTVTWSHVYNPLGLEALPVKGSESRLLMDDLRLSPFRGIDDQGFEDNKGTFLMTTDGDAVWKVDDKDSNSGSYSIVASTKDIKQDSGSSNVNFVLYSEEGGALKYKISTSTTAPHDDFVILLNGKAVDAVFGLMPSFEYELLDIPMGKVAVTLQHRKNPGKLSAGVLDGLGTVRTKGFTRLDDVRFEPN